MWHIRSSREAADAHVADGDFPCRHHRVHRADRRRVVDDAFETRRKPEQLAQPAERDGLELGCRRRCPPEHRLLVERRGEQIGEDARRAAGAREIREEAGVIPVREAGHEHALEVGHDALERLAVFRCGCGKRRGDLARRDAGENGIALGVFEVISDPVDEGVRVATEIRRIHHHAS